MRFLDSGSPLRCGRNDEFSYRANKQLSDQSDLKLSWPMHAFKWMMRLREVEVRAPIPDEYRYRIC